jgi:methyl-accepting chemotaxis protein
MRLKLSLKMKLVSLCVILSGLSLLVGVTSYYSLKDVQTEYAYIPSAVMPKLENISDMFLSYRRVRITLRTLGLPGLTPAQAEEAIRDTEHAIADYEKSEKAYFEIQSVPGQKELDDKLKAAWVDFKKTGEEVLTLYHSGTPESKERIIKIFFTDCPQKAKIFTIAMNELRTFHNNVALEKVQLATAGAERASLKTICLIAIGVFAGLLIGFIFANALAKSLNRISLDIALAADQTAAGGTQLAAASSQLSSGSSECAASLEETVASLEELSSMVKINSEHANQASQLSHSSQETAEKGENEIGNLISVMSDIAGSSKKIEEIINVIDDIAFQTNLLALNAAVEAARAGEQGKGFAVVAEAVRNLAQRSASAAKDIASLIKENVSKSGDGSKAAGASGVVLKNILDSAKKVASLNAEIAAGSQEQTNGIQQISQAMNQLDQATQGNASSAEEVAASSEEMSEQARTLKTLVSDLQIIITGRSAEVETEKVISHVAPVSSRRQVTRQAA